MARRRSNSAKSVPTRAEKSIHLVSDRAGVIYANTFLHIVNYLGSIAARHLGPTALDILTKVYNDDIHDLTGGYPIAPGSFVRENYVVNMCPSKVSPGLLFGMHLHFSVPLPKRVSMNLGELSIDQHDERRAYTALLSELRAELGCLRPLALQLATEHNLVAVGGVVRTSQPLGAVEPITLGLSAPKGDVLYGAPSLALALLETLDPSGPWLKGIAPKHLKSVPLRSISLAEEKLAVLAAIGKSFVPVGGDADTISSPFAASVTVGDAVPLLRYCPEAILPVGFQVGSFEDINSLRFAGTTNKLRAGSGFWNFVARVTTPV